MDERIAYNVAENAGAVTVVGISNGDIPKRRKQMLFEPTRISTRSTVVFRSPFVDIRQFILIRCFADLLLLYVAFNRRCCFNRPTTTTREPKHTRVSWLFTVLDLLPFESSPSVAQFGENIIRMSLHNIARARVNTGAPNGMFYL